MISVSDEAAGEHGQRAPSVRLGTSKNSIARSRHHEADSADSIERRGTAELWACLYLPRVEQSVPGHTKQRGSQGGDQRSRLVRPLVAMEGSDSIPGIL